MRLLISIAASLGLISLAIAAIALARSFEERDPGAVERLQDEVSDLRKRIEEVEGGVRRSAGKLEELQAAAGASTAPADPDAGADRRRAERDDVAAAFQAEARRLQEMIEMLEGKLEDLERKALPGPTAESAAALTALTEEQRQAAALENHRIALDETRELQARVQSLRKLRSLDAISRQVTGAMTRLIEDPQVPSKVRADIIRNLHRVSFDELKDPLLRAVTADPDPEVRSEAAETLDAFLNDPQVEQTLRFVKENDPHEGVRREAAIRLEAFGKAPEGGGR